MPVGVPGRSTPTGGVPGGPAPTGGVPGGPAPTGGVPGGPAPTGGFPGGIGGTGGNPGTAPTFPTASADPSAKTGSGTSDTKACFAGTETVMLESGKVKIISAVRVGDRVLAADASRRFLYSEVVFIPHGANEEKALFTYITTTEGKNLKMSGSHILPAGHCDSPSPLHSVSASMVKIGDCVMTTSGMEKVSAVETVQGQGLYTIVTKDEYVVVNGIIASPFAYNHMLGNLYYNIHRFIYACVPGVLSIPLIRSANEVRSSMSLSAVVISVYCV
jgi:Hint module